MKGGGAAAVPTTLARDDREEPNGPSAATARFKRKRQSPTAKFSRLV
jgi:hypothetical protein